MDISGAGVKLNDHGGMPMAVNVNTLQVNGVPKRMRVCTRCLRTQAKQPKS